MVALVACLGVLYLRAPSDDRLTLLVLGAVLLTESRYESVIFVVPAAIVVAAGWARAGRVILPWPVIIAPILLVPYAWHSRVLSATPLFWQLQEGQTSAFGVSNIVGNLRGDIAFLFNTGTELANSWYLSALGLAGLAWFLVCAGRWLVRRPRAPLPAAVIVAVLFGAGVAGHFVVLLFYWWAKFNDVLASRFSLPMCLAFSVLAAVLVKAAQDRRLPALRLAAAGLGVWLLAGGLPAIARRLYTDQNSAMQEVAWEHAVIESRPGPILLISNKSTIPFVLWHIETIISAVGAQRGEEIRYHMSQDTFKEVIVAQAVRPSDADGDMGVDPDDMMPPSFHLQMVAEKRFGSRLDRLSRIVSIDPQPGGAVKADYRPADPAELLSISEVQSRSEPPVAAATSSAESR
jgi:hypothetical protein